MNEIHKCMKGCLHGSRRVIYENVYMAAKSADGTLKDPKGVYDAIKSRLMKFCETAMEKQLRVRRDWDSFWKNKGMNAQQFEAKWEQVHVIRRRVGKHGRTECSLQ